MSSFLSVQDRNRLNTPATVQRWYAAFFPPMVIDFFSTPATDWVEEILPQGGSYPLHPSQVYLAPYAPHVQLGPTMRIGFLGETVGFWAGDSFMRGGGAVPDNSVWSWDASGPGGTIEYVGPSMGFTAGAVGLHTISCTCTYPNGATHTAYRYLRTFQDRDHCYDAIVAVDQLQGSVDQGGWTCGITVLDGTPQTAPYTGVCLYVEDVYGEDPDYDMTTVGPGDDRYDPSVAMCGYITTSTVENAYDSDQAQFTVEGSHCLLQDLQTWDIPFWVTAELGTSNMFGHVIDNLAPSDMIWHVLQDHTTYSDWHDLVLCQSEQHYIGLTIKSGTVWDGLKALSDNQYFFQFTDKGGSFHSEPDRALNSPDWWGSRYFLFPAGQPNFTGDSFYVDGPTGQVFQPPLHFSDRPFYDPQDSTQALDVTAPCLSMEVIVLRRANTAYVKLICPTTQGAGQITATYPQGDAASNYLAYPTTADGQWLVVTDKVLDDTSKAWAWAWKVAYRLFKKQNAAFPQVTVKAPGRVYGVDLNDMFWATRTNRLGESDLTRAEYACQQVTFTIDEAQHVTTTEVVGTAMTYDNTDPPVPPYYPGTKANLAAGGA